MRYLQTKIKLAIVLLFGFLNSISCQSYLEGFEDFSNLTDWFVQNNSGSPDAMWGAGDATIFNAQSGSFDSYLSVNFQSTSNPVGATISNWLLTPTRTYNNGDVITFYSRTVSNPLYPDRLEVRFSSAGNGIDCGALSTEVGTFSTLLLTINPNLTTTGYPQEWTQYTITISGLSGPTNGRVAFRYFVTNGGPNGPNADYIGIDSYTYTSVASQPVNDDCAGAINLLQGSSCIPTNGSVAYATESLPACSGEANNDVWYKFTANSSDALISVNGSPAFDAVYEVFSGNCANLNSISCIDIGIEGESESIVFSNLNPGQIYYIRVHDWLDDIPNTMTFDVCVEQFIQCVLIQPSGSMNETEACYENNNGGCNSNPAVFQSITCGDTIYGSCWAEGGDRDLDWYNFQINSPGNVTWSAQAEFPFYLAIVDISNCVAPVILSSANFSACQLGTINYNFNSTGNYAVIIAPSLINNYPCGFNNDYISWIQLPNVPAPIQLSSNVLCPNDTVQLFSSLNSSFNWYLNNNSIGQGIVFNATQPGSYYASYTDVNGCFTTSNVLNLSSMALDDASFAYSNNTVCSGSSNMAAISNSSGIFTSIPTGLVFVDSNSGEIDVSQSVNGNYIITFQTNGVCPNSSSQSFVITSNPIASFHYSDSIFCTNSQNEQVILGNGASIGVFSSSSPQLSINPNTGEIDLSQSSIGIYTIYNLIAASGACSQVIDSVDIIVQGPSIDFPLTDTLCPSSGLITLTASPSGGIFSGTSIENNEFNTSLGSSMVTYTYTDSSGCTNHLSQFVNVETPINIDFGQYADMCLLDNEILLNQGQPTGGIYSGIGVQNNYFDPALGIIGSNVLLYTITSSNGCSDSISGIIKVNENPQIIFEPLPEVCDTTQPFELVGVTPIGGLFSGPGVSNGNFTPSMAGIGTHTIEYMYSINGCTSVATQTITVDFCSGLQDLATDIQLFPNPTNSIFYVKGIDSSVPLYIYSMDNKLIKSSCVNEGQQIDLTVYATGSYIIQIKNKDQILHFKVLKN